MLALATVLLATQHAWREAIGVAILWSIYMLTLRLARCRVETLNHRPCKWRVRGLLGTCDYHVHYKRGLPVLYNMGSWNLPMFMWRRQDIGQYRGRPEPQPAPTASSDAATAERARKPMLDLVTALAGVLSLLVAFASFLRDLLAG